MSKGNSFKNLEIWTLSREICDEFWEYFETTSLENDYGLKNQMNKSSGSVMDNIAEDFKRNGNREFLQFLSISKASCGELRPQLYRCLDRKHISQEQFNVTFSKTITEEKNRNLYGIFKEI